MQHQELMSRFYEMFKEKLIKKTNRSHEWWCNSTIFLIVCSLLWFYSLPFLDRTVLKNIEQPELPLHWKLLNGRALHHNLYKQLIPNQTPLRIQTSLQHEFRNELSTKIKQRRILMDNGFSFKNLCDFQYRPKIKIFLLNFWWTNKIK